MTGIGKIAASGAGVRLKAERFGDRDARSIAFLFGLWGSLAFAVICLAVLLITAFVDGVPRLDGNLLTQYNSQIRPETGGARAAIVGSAWVIAVTAFLAIPLGVAAGLYLEEFADNDRWYNRLIEVNLANLAAVPAIIYGMLAAGFALAIGLERRFVLTAGIALALLVLPVIIIATREALRAVPAEIRSGSLALGATPLVTAWKQTLPAAVPGIATGTILALSRAFGEAAPLLLLGAAVSLRTDPSGLFSSFTTLPIQIYNWVQQPQVEYQQLASAAIIVMLVLLLAMNAVAVIIRNKFQKRW